MTNTRSRRWVPAVMIAAVLVGAAAILITMWPSPQSQQVSLTGVTSSYTVRLDFGHPVAGSGTVQVSVQRRDHGTVAVDQVALEAVMPRMGHAMPELLARPSGDGRFTATGQLFLMSGVWEVSARLSAPGAPAETATVTVPVSAG